MSIAERQWTVRIEDALRGEDLPREDDVAIAVRDLSKRFGRFQAVDGVSFEVPAGQLVALLGPSGSGKSTILRIIAGLEPADSGTVELTGADATDLPVRHQGVGLVFQHYALFRHMTVRQNVAFGLEIRGLPRREVRAGRPAARVGATRRPRRPVPVAALRWPAAAGGLGACAAPEPKVLLLDEPFGALDAQVRDELRSWIRRLHDEVNVTSLLVTHDQQEAFEVADQVIVLNRGRVEQIGPPQDLYERPSTPYVTEFLGAVNVLRPETMLGMARHEGGLSIPSTAPGAGDPATIYIRPHDLDVERHHDSRPSWPARVDRLVPLGGLVRLDLALADGTGLRVQMTRERWRELSLARGDDVFVAPRDLKVFRQARSKAGC